MNIQQIIEKFVILHGKPTLIVAHTSCRFELRNTIQDMPGIVVCLLPSLAWARNKVYLENFITRKVEHLSSAD